ncbi:HVO_2142 family zinc finger protein [Haloferax namakaokahaiae]|uniref:HVO_2142 family zinc finger protein n=1 Tax=Haloferax namakaokahaiae TaxID=1748331 RepID=A0ABD5ZK13_9EURY
MDVNRPQDLSPEWCPDCGEELLFSGMQPAGIAQFFCEHCRYRRDTFIGDE